MPLEQRCADRKRKYEADLALEIEECDKLKEEVQRREDEIERRKALWSHHEEGASELDLALREAELQAFQTDHVRHRMRFSIHEADVNRRILELKTHKQLMRDYKSLLDKFETGVIDFQLAVYVTDTGEIDAPLEDFEGLKGDFECLTAELAKH
jgi:chromosome segregation ATPase